MHTYIRNKKKLVAYKIRTHNSKIIRRKQTKTRVEIQDIEDNISIETSMKAKADLIGSIELFCSQPRKRTQITKVGNERGASLRSLLTSSLKIIKE